MKNIQLIDGKLFVDGQEVFQIMFTDGSAIYAPFGDMCLGIDETTILNTGKNATIISGKNIVSPESVINCKGDFRLGDG